MVPQPSDLSEPIPVREWEDLHFDSDGQKLRTKICFRFRVSGELGHMFNSREMI